MQCYWLSQSLNSELSSVHVENLKEHTKTKVISKFKITMKINAML